MRINLAVCVVLAGVAPAVGLADAPAGPAKDVPELQALSHWVGEWDTEMTVKANADLARGMSRKGTTTAEWVLNGRFLQQTWILKPDDGSPATQGTTFMTYDPRKKVYRSWMFNSTGSVSESEGTWDEKSRTMTSTIREAEAGTTTTIKATFAADGTENWSFTTRDRDGKVVRELAGRNTRRKK
jgi:hypothetical protein